MVVNGCSSVYSNYEIFKHIPAEDLGERQYFSVTVPYGHGRGFTAAQTAQEGRRCLLLLVHFSVYQVLLRPTVTHSLHIAHSVFIIYRNTRTPNLLIRFVIIARGGEESESFDAVDLHKRQVKLEK